MKRDLLLFLPRKLQEALKKANLNFDQLQEIRIRINNPMMILYDNKEVIPDENLKITSMDIRETMEYVSRHSMYAFEEDIRQGFITIEGGHRIGLAGKVVMEHGEIKTIKNISFINIRMSHEIKGCADSIINSIAGNGKVSHTLIISPPGYGKTTLLRDIVRQISNGENGLLPSNVVVLDERSEIAGSYNGVPQNDVGIRTDVLDCCPKDKGMLMAIRTMSPKVIAIDEIGGVKDVDAIEYAINCGCKVIATIHGNHLEDILSRPYINQIVQKKMFEKIIVVRQKGIYEVVKNF